MHSHLRKLEIKFTAKKIWGGLILIHGKQRDGKVLSEQISKHLFYFSGIEKKNYLAEAMYNS